MRSILTACLMAITVVVGCRPSASDGAPDYDEVDEGKAPDDGVSSSSGTDEATPASGGSPTAQSEAPADSSPADGGSGAAEGAADAGADAAASGPREAASTSVWSRKIVLTIDDAKDMGWATIGNGDPGDEVWLDRSYDGGKTWEPKLGDTTIPSGYRSTRTASYAVDDPAHPRKGQLRACGKAGNRPEIACTPWRGTL